MRILKIANNEKQGLVHIRYEVPVNNDDGEIWEPKGTEAKLDKYPDSFWSAWNAVVPVALRVAGIIDCWDDSFSNGEGTTLTAIEFKYPDREQLVIKVRIKNHIAEYGNASAIGMRRSDHPALAGQLRPIEILQSEAIKFIRGEVRHEPEAA